jgi:hypothetical protein
MGTVKLQVWLGWQQISKTGRNISNTYKSNSSNKPTFKRYSNNKCMKNLTIGFLILILYVQQVNAQQKNTINPGEKEIVELSKQKWDWMSEKNADSLSVLFDAKCDFVHMGGTWGKEREIDIIKGGFIWYKKAVVYSTAVKFFGNTAVILSDIDLVAVVGTRDAINPFMVTEVFIKENGSWKLGQLTFSHLSRPLKLDANSK